jgi:hypothetical protein
MIQGIGFAIMLNTATSLISDVIGKEAKNSAVVYGIYGFMDKVANGIIIFVITSYYNTNPTALRWIMGVVPCFCSISAFLLALYGSVAFKQRMAKLSVTKRFDDGD